MTLPAQEASGWSASATCALIAVWGEVDVQQKLDSVKRNKIIYEEIAEKMREEGIEFTWEQCRTKAKNLTQRYRKVRGYKNICTLLDCKYDADQI